MKDKRKIAFSFAVWLIAIAGMIYSAYTYRYWGRNLPFNMNKAKSSAESYLENLCNTDFDVTDGYACYDMGVHGYEIELMDRKSGIPARVLLETDLSVVKAEFPPGNDITR